MPADVMTVQGRSTRTGAPMTVMVKDGTVESVDHGAGDAAPDIWLAPGFVDLQVNGYGGFDFNRGEAEQVSRAVSALVGRGTTAVVPTVITGSAGEMQDRLAAVIRAVRIDPPTAAAVPALHIEGPFLSPVDGARGAHDIDHIRPPDIDELIAWQRICAPLPLLVTIAPEWPGAPDFIRQAVALGVTISLGHSVADPGQIAAAIGGGASLSTHLGNGAPLMLPRHPNLIWAQLAAPELTAGLIADGFHLDGDTLRAMIRAKGRSGSFLVSDAVALAGQPPGLYRTPVGGEVELDPEGRLRVAGQQYLAGAAVDLAAGVARLPGLTGLSLRRAVTMATAVPGRILALAAAAGRGRQPKIGRPVDLVRFRWAPGDTDLQILDVLVPVS
ncbi:N-acetylglucosamine-6-phosphate deacetylase [Nakamurella sp. UYEF19]|uniref:N-acetylglucosamine-6-phosphate deacetylase n=1 Tax=Nakamurella sp. UYEF19 TaxID=1756392 RepID=UPI003398C24D